MRLENQSTAGTVRRALAACFGFAWRAAALAGGVAVLVGYVSNEDSTTGVDGTHARIVARASGDMTRITLVPKSGEPSSLFSLNDEGGRELMLVHLRRDGCVEFSAGVGTPARVMGETRPNGWLNFGMGNRRTHFRIEVEPDGSSLVVIRDRDERVLSRFRVPQEQPPGCEKRPAEAAKTPSD